MIDSTRKFVAVLLAVWLPLISGNTLAASITMQSMNGDCHVAHTNVVQTNVAIPDSQRSHHAATMHQHMQHANHLAQQVQLHDHQNDRQQTSHKDCGVCQLACCGYMAAVVIEVAQIQPSAQLFIPAVTQFQSIFSAPLVPPPLALA